MVAPPLKVSVKGPAPDLVTMLITPAMASEPYWAAAPSRRTSMRSIAETGIALRSTPVEPRPMLPLRCTSALVCRRLPLMSTSTWSGPRPRRVAGRTESVPSVMVGRGKLKDGASFWMTCMVSLRPVASICRAVMMSTGTAFSASAPMAREPTVISSWKPRPSAKSWVTVPVSRIGTSRGLRPAKVALRSTVCPAAEAGTSRR